MGRVKKKRGTEGEKTVSVALAGNPNVGKSTLFNTLTGMHRHTGNWAGKTVSTAVADVKWRDKIFSIADIPGTYSLISHSTEEEIARNYICFEEAAVTAVVCDSTALERSIALALQIAEARRGVIVCLNLSDEAKKIGIKIDAKKLSSIMGCRVVSTVARKKRCTLPLLDAIYERSEFSDGGFYEIRYPEKITYAAAMIERALGKASFGGVSRFWIAMRLLEGEESIVGEIYSRLLWGVDKEKVSDAVFHAREYLFSFGIDSEKLKDEIVGAIVKEAEYIAKSAVSYECDESDGRCGRIDRIMTGKFTAFPVMLLLLALVLWITLSLANVPSELLSRFFTYVEGKFSALLLWLHTPSIITDALVYGVYRTLTRVIAVMLPPMAIFFPFFTLLEDSGYLPRVAYNLDRPFACAGACGKQSLTMCMGLGCNAVGISGARIIDSRRERLLAVLTNSFIPCNGRLPMLAAVSSIAFIMIFGHTSGFLVSLSVLFFIVLGIAATFLVTFMLSKTLLVGEQSSFTIELPPYRRPEVVRVVFRSLVTKVLSVLWRAVIVAAPMGLIIFLLSCISLQDKSLLLVIAELFDPLGRLMGLDGAILLAFVLGMPANEIVIPIVTMIYTAAGSVSSDIGIAAMEQLFSANGWSLSTAVCFLTFTLFHWPCSTSLITVYKETHSKKYTALAFLLPTATGLVTCVAINLIFKLFG